MLTAEKVEKLLDLLVTSNLPLEYKELLTDLLSQNQIEEEVVDKLLDNLEQENSSIEEFETLAKEVAESMEDTKKAVEEAQQSTADDFVAEILAEEQKK